MVSKGAVFLIVLQFSAVLSYHEYGTGRRSEVSESQKQQVEFRNQRKTSYETIQNRYNNKYNGLGHWIDLHFPFLGLGGAKGGIRSSRPHVLRTALCVILIGGGILILAVPLAVGIPILIAIPAFSAIVSVAAHLLPGIIIGFSKTLRALIRIPLKIFGTKLSVILQIIATLITAGIDRFLAIATHLVDINFPEVMIKYFGKLGLIPKSSCVGVGQGSETIVKSEDSITTSEQEHSEFQEQSYQANSNGGSYQQQSAAEVSDQKNEY